MATYSKIKQQIAELERQAEELLAAERSKALAKAIELISTFGFDARDLGLVGRGGRKAGTRRASAVHGPRVGVPKYINPKTGATWTGRGRAPEWIKNVRNRDAFLIDSSRDAQAQSALPAVKKSRAARKAASRKAVASRGGDGSTKQARRRAQAKRAPKPGEASTSADRSSPATPAAAAGA